MLPPRDADNRGSVSPVGTCLVATNSTPATAPVTRLRNAVDGTLVREVARGDISRLRAAGWVAPELFTVKARDGRTALYGLMFKPTNFDPKKQYPIVNYVYPGPQTGATRSSSLLASHGPKQALAVRGFHLLALARTGTPLAP